MRQGPNNKRMRGRGGGRKHSNPRNHTYESNGPDVKVRGNPQQIVEKYLALARDAYSAGDRINAESYYQHAEHYYRILNAGQPAEQRMNTPSADMNDMDEPDTDSDTEQSAAEETADAEETAEASANDSGNGSANGSQRSGGGRRRGNGRGNGSRKDPAEEPQPEVPVAKSEDVAAEGAEENAGA